MAMYRLRARCRRTSAILGALALASLVAGVAPALGAPDTIVVTLDRAMVRPVPEGAQTLIVGNPIIADVTLLKDTNDRAMVITGRGFGVTNLIVLDKDGNVLTDQVIRVKADQRSLVVVQRGFERESYACAPRCEPTVRLGDTTLGKTAGDQINARNALATAGNR